MKLGKTTCSQETTTVRCQQVPSMSQKHLVLPLQLLINSQFNPPSVSFSPAIPFLTPFNASQFFFICAPSISLVLLNLSKDIALFPGTKLPDPHTITCSEKSHSFSCQSRPTGRFVCNFRKSPEESNRIFLALFFPFHQIL